MIFDSTAFRPDKLVRCNPIDVSCTGALNLAIAFIYQSITSVQCLHATGASLAWIEVSDDNGDDDDALNRSIENIHLMLR